MAVTLAGPEWIAEASDDELHRLQNDIQAVLYTREATRRQTRLGEHVTGDDDEREG
jgi:hypothetical protein